MAAGLREDAIAIGRAGVRAADPGERTRAALRAAATSRHLAGAAGVRAIAVGKASAAMWAAAAPLLPPVREALVVAPVAPSGTLPAPARLHLSGHPVPTPDSHEAAAAALRVARAVTEGEWLVLLVSGGASALMAAPAGGVSLEDKAQTTRALLRCGADITEINTVRKHLSDVKGGRLARAAGGRCLTLALSDVIGAHEDDLSVIGSGPGVPDASTFGDALAVVGRHGLPRELPPAVLARLLAGAAGELEETPKPGDEDMHLVEAVVIGGRRDAMRGAADEARARGYVTEVIEAPLLGEARDTSGRFAREVLERCRAAGAGRRVCAIASGETTVTVRGGGRGGRNQEFALAAAGVLAEHPGASVALLSIGTDGIDGPTDAAGGLVDETTAARAAGSGASIAAALADNDAYPCLARLGDLVVTGPTGTNVGDLVVVVIAPAHDP